MARRTTMARGGLSALALLGMCALARPAQGADYYVDYEGGDDANPGSREQPWKHHPWDAKATDKAKACKGIRTYVFKGGVVYRGGMAAAESGKPVRISELGLS